MKKKIIICSGYFNPLTVGHLDYLESAAEMGKVVVIVNNDMQVGLKGSKLIQPAYERARIVKSLKPVYEVFISTDFDRSVNQTLHDIHLHYPNDYLYFYNDGGEYEQCLEYDTCSWLGIECIYGKNKKTGSSTELRERIESA